MKATRAGTPHTLDGMIQLETERLTLRPVSTDDLDGLAPIYADPEVMRYIATGATLDRAATAAGLARFTAAWPEQGFGMFTVVLRETGAIAGWVGMAVPLFLPEVLPAVEIGWRFARRYWGRGLATEGGRAAAEFAFTDAGLDRLVSIRHVDNRASGRVMVKLGMSFDRRTTVPAHGGPVEVWAITRSQWRVDGALHGPGDKNAGGRVE
jgi:RimJ/RimL family protein N-acetyltransferase